MASMEAIGDSVTSLDSDNKASLDGTAGKAGDLKAKLKASIANLGSSIDSGNNKLANSMGEAKNSLGSICVNIKTAGEASKIAGDLLTNATNTGDGANSEAPETLAGNILTSLTSLKTSWNDGNTKVSTTIHSLHLLSANLLFSLAALKKELKVTGSSVSSKIQTRRI